MNKIKNAIIWFAGIGFMAFSLSNIYADEDCIKSGLPCYIADGCIVHCCSTHAECAGAGNCICAEK